MDSSPVLTHNERSNLEKGLRYIKKHPPHKHTHAHRSRHNKRNRHHTVPYACVKLYDSGISGTAMLLSQITPHFLSLSFFLILLNILLFLYGLKKQGRDFTFSAVYTVIVYSVSAWLITDVLPLDVSIASPLAGTDLLLCALFG
ncbi:Uncharacterised 5xTM membrane BCR, YitT family COG1284 [Ruminococcus sp. XPD3002]|nr:Uncharacterised 5xTM membrane BCR, YitT family COG1284 [Ruminococcus flavefaciens]